ncbi:hypothetical protein [Streptomyces sp. NPDC002851]
MSAAASDPVSRTILLLDIEKYSDRDDVEQAYLRRMLYDLTDETLEAAGIDETLRLRADRGDSVMELIDANASVPALLRALLTEVPIRLRATNRMASSSAQIRLRAVLATGYVAVDGHGGWVGSQLNHACRLLDAELLRRALRQRPDDFALCVSDAVHAGIVRQGHPGIPAEEFHAITVDSKNGPLSAWLHGPVPEDADAASVADATSVAEAEAPRTADDKQGTAAAPPAGPPAAAIFNGNVTFGGGYVAGDQHGVSGGQVTGDVHVGGTGNTGTGTGTGTGTTGTDPERGERP